MRLLIYVGDLIAGFFIFSLLENCDSLLILGIT